MVEIYPILVRSIKQAESNQGLKLGAHPVCVKGCTLGEDSGLNASQPLRVAIGPACSCPAVGQPGRSQSSCGEPRWACKLQFVDKFILVMNHASRNSPHGDNSLELLSQKGNVDTAASPLAGAPFQGSLFSRFKKTTFLLILAVYFYPVLFCKTGQGTGFK